MHRPWNKGIKINRKTHPTMGNFTDLSKKKISFNGEELYVQEWAEKIGISKSCLWQRIKKYGLSIEDALTRPKRYHNKLLKGRKITWVDKLSGKNSHRWIEDRTKLLRVSGGKERNSPMYKSWRKEVCDRDGWKCKINNDACGGRLEVHHINSFKEFPELKYDVNNGICLCKKHHPKKRIMERILINLFKELIAT